MKVTDELILNLSSLSKLIFDKSNAEKMKKDLQKILKFVNKLSEINTDEVEPLIYLSNEINILRDDDEITELTQEEALKNAPKKDSDYFKVPTVVKK